MTEQFESCTCRKSCEAQHGWLPPPQGGRPFEMQSENAPAIPAPTPPNGGQDPKTKGGGGMPTMPAVPSGPQSCPVVPSENARQRIRFFWGVFPLKAGVPAHRRGPFVPHICVYWDYWHSNKGPGPWQPCFYQTSLPDFCDFAWMPFIYEW